MHVRQLTLDYRVFISAPAAAYFYLRLQSRRVVELISFDFAFARSNGAATSIFHARLSLYAILS